MIARTHRFHGRASIQRVYKGGKLSRSAYASLRYMANPRAGSYRLSVVVSKKVSKKAVVRNRIRRRIYEHVRILFGPQSDPPIPYDFLITVFDERLATLPASELAGEINRLFKKANLA